MTEVLPSIHLIDLRFQGQPGTIGVYVLKGANGENALIETGPASTRAALLEGLRAAEVDPAGIHDVLVTHIHLDHAGAAGVLLRDDLPNARVLVHPVGLTHLIDPSKLIRSATRIYGSLMEPLWGEIAPLPAERVVALEDNARLSLAGHEVEILFTPGHATHHAAVRHVASGAVFTGDVAGVRVPGATVINPPTMPPEFDLAAWERSIDRLLAAEPSALLLIHFGLYTDSRAHLERLRGRLREWVDLTRAGLAAGRTTAEIGAELQRRDIDAPGTDTTGIRQLDLIAGYGMCVGGIARYLEKSAGGGRSG